MNERSLILLDVQTRLVIWKCSRRNVSASGWLWFIDGLVWVGMRSIVLINLIVGCSCRVVGPVSLFWFPVSVRIRGCSGNVTLAFHRHCHRYAFRCDLCFMFIMFFNLVLLILFFFVWRIDADNKRENMAQNDPSIGNVRVDGKLVQYLGVAKQSKRKKTRAICVSS